MASTLQSAINTLSNGVSKLTTAVSPATVRSGFGAVTSDASKVNPKTAALTEAAARGERVFPWEFDDHTRPYVASPRDPSSTPPALFKPITIKNTTYKNRIVVSPMCMYSSPNGLLTDWHLVHLGSFAIHGAGAIIIEASSVTPNGRISEYDSGIWSDAHIAPLKKVTDFIHQQHALVGIQLAHAGRKASTPAPFFVPRGGDKTTTPDSELGWTKDVWGPSAIPWDKNWIEPIALPKADIPKLIDAFVQAAQRADKAGIDYVEIHAAHGYLFSSWLSPLSNTRTDEYGGSRENRSRVLIETLKAVRAVWSTKPLWVRLSSDEFVPGGWSSDDTVWLAGELKRAGADVVDCSAGGNSADQKFPKLEEGYQVPYAEAVKKAHPDLTVAAVGMITKADFANKVIEDGKADFVLIAREFLRDPALVTRWAGQLDYEVNWQPQYARAKPSHSKHKQIETATQSDVGSGIKNRNLIE